MAKEFDKLVRDRIPELIRADGETPVVHEATEEEYADRLAEKLEEEVHEYHESREMEELVDLVEVIHAIRRHQGYSVGEFQQLRDKKADRRGRFEEGIVLERID